MPVFKLFCLLLCVLILEGCGERQGGKTPNSQATGSQTQGSGRQGVLSYEIGDAGVAITDCEEAAEGNLEIPAEIEGLPVTRIGFEAFYGCRSLISITIPEGVTSIGNDAFYDCNSLTSITITDSVTSIGDTAFYRCSSLTSITIPDSVTRIGRSAFGRCRSLTSIAIPQAFHSGAEAFRLGLDELWPDGFALPDNSSK